jgi:hypothetical protein
MEKWKEKKRRKEKKMENKSTREREIFILSLY